MLTVFLFFVIIRLVILLIMMITASLVKDVIQTLIFIIVWVILLFRFIVMLLIIIFLFFVILLRLVIIVCLLVIMFRLILILLLTCGVYVAPLCFLTLNLLLLIYRRLLDWRHTLLAVCFLLLNLFECLSFLHYSELWSRLLLFLLIHWLLLLRDRFLLFWDHIAALFWGVRVLILVILIRLLLSFILFEIEGITMVLFLGVLTWGRLVLLIAIVIIVMMIMLVSSCGILLLLMLGTITIFRGIFRLVLND
jgi:hypothetical protein